MNNYPIDLVIVELYHVLSFYNESIEYYELNDHAYLREYTKLVRTRRLIKRAIRKFERIIK